MYHPEGILCPTPAVAAHFTLLRRGWVIQKEKILKKKSFDTRGNFLGFLFFGPFRLSPSL